MEKELDVTTKAAVVEIMKGPVPGSTLGVMKIVMGEGEEEEGEEGEGGASGAAKGSSGGGGDENFFDHDAATALRIARKGSMDGVVRIFLFFINMIIHNIIDLLLSIPLTYIISLFFY